MIDTTLLSGIYGAEKPDDPNGKPEDRLGIKEPMVVLPNTSTLIPMIESIRKPCGNG